MFFVTLIVLLEIMSGMVSILINLNSSVELIGGYIWTLTMADGFLVPTAIE